MSRFASRRDRRNRQAFEKARAEAGETGMVCGYTAEDGTPHYFIVPRGASDEEIRDRAFQAIHGRPMNRAEMLLAAAANGDFVRAYEQTMAHYLEREDAVAD
jgi:hypothetical protein